MFCCLNEPLKMMRRFYLCVIRKRITIRVLSMYDCHVFVLAKITSHDTYFFKATDEITVRVLSIHHCHVDFEFTGRQL